MYLYQRSNRYPGTKLFQPLARYQAHTKEYIIVFFYQALQYYTPWPVVCCSEVSFSCLSYQLFMLPCRMQKPQVLNGVEKGAGNFQKSNQVPVLWWPTRQMTASTTRRQIAPSLVNQILAVLGKTNVVMTVVTESV